ncbi:MAG TPA: response regulator [Tepidisphaeraceae bacterium]|nr:response regulator [Tepidisphaeraceae bacterium]
MAYVLVVDDDADARELVSRHLRKEGHAVECAPNGQEAMAALMRRTPDVVILDAVMPEMDGVTFLEVIRCYLRWSKLPVIMLTAFSEGMHVRKGVELGVRKTFLKADYHPAELLAHVDACAGCGPDVLPDPPPPSFGGRMN